MKKITVLGNFSGRNAGDAAILGGLLKDISSLYKHVEFLVPTINPRFVKESYPIYNIKPLNLMPWNLSVKILGLPLMRAIRQADLILVTDAILFDRKLYNPLFNYLWTMSKALPFAKRLGIPVVLYNSSLGPVHSKAGKKALTRVVRCADLMILRDKDSFELLEYLGLEHPAIFEGADCALNVEPAIDSRFAKMCEKARLFESHRHVVGFNINSYVDAFVREDGSSFGRDNLVELYAETVDRVIEILDVDVIFVETQHMDMGIAEQVMEAIRSKDRIRIISNKQYNYKEISAVLKRCDLFVGMRTHSLILSAAMGVVPVGILTYPKNRGFMRTIGMEKNLIAFRDLTVDRYVELIVNTFEHRENLKNEMIPKLIEEKTKMQRAAALLQPFLSGYSES